MTTITFNNLSKPDGSALIDQNDTIVQASVYGPVDVTQAKINYEEAIVEILFKPKVSIPATSPAFEQILEIENLLKCIFKEVILTRLHPRTSISILVQEIHNEGSLLSSSINAVCCALIDASVAMKCPVTGVSIKLEQLDSKPSKFEFAFDSKLNLITIITRGIVSDEQLNRAVTLGQEEANANFETMRERVRKRFTN